MKKLLTVAALGIVSGLVSLTTLAADNWSLGGISETAAMIVDVSTIEQNRGIKGTWVVFVNPQLVDGTDYSVSWWEFNCQSKKVRITDISERRFGVIKVGTQPDINWQRVEPNSFGEGVLNNVCKGPLAIFGSYETIEDAAWGFREKAKKVGDWK